MQQPQSYTRLMLANAFDGKTPLPITGVYILAYIGKAADVAQRLYAHCSLQHRRLLPVDVWLANMHYHNIRLDILECPFDTDNIAWNTATEAACIRHFRPLLNTQLN